MNKQKQQKFLTLFNDMLSDKNGVSSLEKMWQGTNRGDEVDVATKQKEQDLNMRLDQRNLLFLKKVEEAKQKIIEGSYGQCEDCGSEISQKRLLARPTAALCVDCQEEKEREESCNINKRRDLKTQKFQEADMDDHIIKNTKFNNVKDISFESVVDF